MGTLTVLASWALRLRSRVRRTIGGGGRRVFRGSRCWRCANQGGTFQGARWRWRCPKLRSCGETAWQHWSWRLLL